VLIIQQANQYLIIILTLVIARITPKKLETWFCDIIQVYTQANTVLVRLILQSLPTYNEFRLNLPRTSILLLLLLLL
jgi:hypothetical protein